MSRLQTAQESAQGSERTPQIIAAEINSYIGHSRKTRLLCAIEIGQRLAEAKKLVAHGEWHTWLAQAVNYSSSTAARLMQIAKEYGPMLPATRDRDSSANHATLQDLTYSQALILIDIPEDERLEIIAGLDIENTTTLELKKIVQEHQEMQQERAEIQQTLSEEKAKTTTLTEEIDSLKTQTQSFQSSKKELEDKIEAQHKKLQEFEKDYNYTTMTRMKTRLNKVHSKVLANKIPYLLDDLDETFRRLMQELKGSGALEKEAFDLYKQRVHGFLLKALEAVAMI